MVCGLIFYFLINILFNGSSGFECFLIHTFLLFLSILILCFSVKTLFLLAFPCHYLDDVQVVFFAILAFPFSWIRLCPECLFGVCFLTSWTCNPNKLFFLLRFPEKSKKATIKASWPQSLVMLRSVFMSKFWILFGFTVIVSIISILNFWFVSLHFSHFSYRFSISVPLRLCTSSTHLVTPQALLPAWSLRGAAKGRWLEATGF